MGSGSSKPATVSKVEGDNGSAVSSPLKKQRTPPTRGKPAHLIEITAAPTSRLVVPGTREFPPVNQSVVQQKILEDPTYDDAQRLEKLMGLITYQEVQGILVRGGEPSAAQRTECNRFLAFLLAKRIIVMPPKEAAPPTAVGPPPGVIPIVEGGGAVSKYRDALVSQAAASTPTAPAPQAAASRPTAPVASTSIVPGTPSLDFIMQESNWRATLFRRTCEGYTGRDPIASKHHDEIREMLEADRTAKGTRLAAVKYAEYLEEYKAEQQAKFDRESEELAASSQQLRQQRADLAERKRAHDKQMGVVVPPRGRGSGRGSYPTRGRGATQSSVPSQGYGRGGTTAPRGGSMRGRGSAREHESRSRSRSRESTGSSSSFLAPSGYEFACQDYRYKKEREEKARKEREAQEKKEQEAQRMLAQARETERVREQQKLEAARKRRLEAGVSEAEGAVGVTFPASFAGAVSSPAPPSTPTPPVPTTVYEGHLTKLPLDSSEEAMDDAPSATPTAQTTGVTTAPVTVSTTVTSPGPGILAAGKQFSATSLPFTLVGKVKSAAGSGATPLSTVTAPLDPESEEAREQWLKDRQASLDLLGNRIAEQLGGTPGQVSLMPPPPPPGFKRPATVPSRTIPTDVREGQPRHEYMGWGYSPQGRACEWKTTLNVKKGDWLGYQARTLMNPRTSRGPTALVFEAGRDVDIPGVVKSVPPEAVEWTMRKAMEVATSFSMTATPVPLASPPVVQRETKPPVRERQRSGERSLTLSSTYSAGQDRGQGPMPSSSVGGGTPPMSPASQERFEEEIQELMKRTVEPVDPPFDDKPIMTGAGLLSTFDDDSGGHQSGDEDDYEEGGSHGTYDSHMTYESQGSYDVRPDDSEGERQQPGGAEIQDEAMEVATDARTSTPVHFPASIASRPPVTDKRFEEMGLTLPSAAAVGPPPTSVELGGPTFGGMSDVDFLSRQEGWPKEVESEMDERDSDYVPESTVDSSAVEGDITDPVALHTRSHQEAGTGPVAPDSEQETGQGQEQVSPQVAGTLQQVVTSVASASHGAELQAGQSLREVRLSELAEIAGSQVDQSSPRQPEAGPEDADL